MIAVSDELIVRNIVEERSTIRGDLQKSAMTTSFGRRRPKIWRGGWLPQCPNDQPRRASGRSGQPLMDAVDCVAVGWRAGLTL
jgi:hypothetical protein